MSDWPRLTARRTMSRRWSPGSAQSRSTRAFPNRATPISRCEAPAMEPSSAHRTQRNRALRGSAGKNLGGNLPPSRRPFKHSSPFSRCFATAAGQRTVVDNRTGSKRLAPETANCRLLSPSVNNSCCCLSFSRRMEIPQESAERSSVSILDERGARSAATGSTCGHWSGRQKTRAPHSAELAKQEPPLRKITGRGRQSGEKGARSHFRVLRMAQRVKQIRMEIVIAP